MDTFIRKLAKEHKVHIDKVYQALKEATKSANRSGYKKGHSRWTNLILNGTEERVVALAPAKEESSEKESESARLVESVG